MRKSNKYVEDFFFGKYKPWSLKKVHKLTVGGLEDALTGKRRKGGKRRGKKGN